MKRVLAVACLVMVGAMVSYGTIVYQDDCSTANGWANIANPSGNATFSSDGSTVSFTEPNGGMSPGNAATWGTSQMDFDASQKDRYTLTFDILSLTDSASYKFAIDEFNSSGGWLNTIWNVFPTVPEDRTTIGVSGPGTIDIDLGTLTYNANTAKIAPKFDLTTGNGNQTLKIDSVTLDMEAIPEPATAAMMIGAGFVLVLVRKGRNSRA
jgi:hypothetical protein